MKLKHSDAFEKSNSFLIQKWLGIIQPKQRTEIWWFHEVPGIREIVWIGDGQHSGIDIRCQPQFVHMVNLPSNPSIHNPYVWSIPTGAFFFPVRSVLSEVFFQVGLNQLGTTPWGGPGFARAKSEMVGTCFLKQHWRRPFFFNKLESA